MTFVKLGLDAQLSSTVTELGYSAPTPIQEQAIPAVLEGRDVVGLAQTGTGKTAAFALPIIQRLLASKKRGVRALIVAPTRELAQQIDEALKKYCKGTPLKSTTIYGGIRMASQLKRLKQGVDIVVGCPGRLCDHVGRRTLDLSGVETLVLDEADHMFDMGFLPDVRKLISFVPKNRQTLLFSATMPKEIRGLAEDVLTDPVRIQVSDGEMASTVSHALFPIVAEKKTQLLEKILKQFKVTSTIIFARTKQRTKRLADTLQRSGYKVACLQGNLSQMRRQEAIKGFRDGRFDILVATDIAARGIDVQQVTHVINFDIPMTVEGYTHRIGRTGRAAKEGEAFTLISAEDESRVRAIERKLGAKIERRRLDDFDYGHDAYDGSVREHSSGSGRSARSSERPRFDRARSDRSRSERPRSGGDRFTKKDRAPGVDAKSEGTREDRPRGRFSGGAGRGRDEGFTPNRERGNNPRSERAPYATRGPAKPYGRGARPERKEGFGDRSERSSRGPAGERTFRPRSGDRNGAETRGRFPARDNRYSPKPKSDSYSERSPSRFADRSQRPASDRPRSDARSEGRSFSDNKKQPWKSERSPASFQDRKEGNREPRTFGSPRNDRPRSAGAGRPPRKGGPAPRRKFKGKTR